MPRGKWANLGVLKSVKARLNEIAREEGFTSPNDVIAYLIRVYEEHKSLLAFLKSVAPTEAGEKLGEATAGKQVEEKEVIQ